MFLILLNKFKTVFWYTKISKHFSFHINKRMIFIWENMFIGMKSQVLLNLSISELGLGKLHNFKKKFLNIL